MSTRTGTHLVSPRKGFNFQIEFPGWPFENFICQEVTLPNIEIEEVPHSEGNHDIKTGGRVKIDKLTLKNLAPSRNDNPNHNSLFWIDWANVVQDIFINGGGEPSDYYRSIIIREVGNDGVSILNVHVYSEVWPSKINGLALNRMASENTVTTVEFSVNFADMSLV